MPNLATSCLPEAVGVFRRAYPEVIVSVHPDNSVNLVEMIEIEQQTRQDREERVMGQAEVTKELVRNLAHEQSLGRRGVLVDAICPGHCRTDMGGPDAPRSAEEGAETIVWLATRSAAGAETGLLWEDRQIVPW